MLKRVPALLLSTLPAGAALVPPAADTLAIATESCVGAGEETCAPEAPPPSDVLEHQIETAISERTPTEQAPPPGAQPMPPGRGTQWDMYDDAAYQRRRDAHFAMDSQMTRNAVLLDLPSPEDPKSSG
jgi:hypothetical protein